MIVSTVAGRIRVRSKRLKDPSLARSVRTRAAALAGVSHARVNAASGSLVVTFDPTRVDTVALEDALEALCLNGNRRPGRTNRLSRTVNRVTKVGMMTSLGTSLAFAVLGNKKAHIGFGTVFVAFAGLHMLRNQKTLVR